MNPISIQEAIDNKKLVSDRVEKIKSEITNLLSKICPELTTFVTSLDFLSIQTVYICLATSKTTINRVEGEFPNKIILTINPVTLEMNTRSNKIFRHIDPNAPSERMYVYQSVKVPFKSVTGWDSILKAIERFVFNYKKTMFENIDLLPYGDICDYPDIFRRKASYLGYIKKIASALRDCGYFNDKTTQYQFFRNGKDEYVLFNGKDRVYVWKSFYDAYGRSVEPKLYEAKNHPKEFYDSKGLKFENNNIYFNEYCN